MKVALSESTLVWNFAGKLTWVKVGWKFAFGEKLPLSSICFALNFDLVFPWRVALGGSWMENCLGWKLDGNLLWRKFAVILKLGGKLGRDWMESCFGWKVALDKFDKTR